VADALAGLVEAPEGKRPRWTVVGPRAQRDAVEAASRAEQEATSKVASDMGIASPPAV